MKKLEELVCSWQQGKRLVELNIDAESIFKWVHPYQLYSYTPNKRNYILVESYKTAGRNSYPAYTLEELLQLLPNDYILGRCADQWFCMSDDFISEPSIYDTTATEACFNALVVVHTFRSEGINKNEDRVI